MSHVARPFLDAERLLRETFLDDVRLFGELGSTNDYAAAIARETRPTPLLIAAERQTAGRGRGSNRWKTACGALLASSAPAMRRMASGAAGAL